MALGVDAAVSHPGGGGGYAVDDRGRPVILPGMAGVCYNVRVGTPVFGWVGDHVEAGVSAGCEEARRHLALQFLACLGNTVRVVSGPAAGAAGTVVGKHAFVLADFPQAALDELAPGDRLLVRGRGQGLRLLDLPDVALRSLGPELLAALPLRLDGGALRLPVAAELPAHMMGAGLGMSSEWANCDVMLTSRETVERLGLERLRIGDLVAMRDQDHRFGRGHRGGMCAVGVVAHGVGVIPGHGTGVITIMSGPEERFRLERDAGANVRDYLNLPD